MRLSYTVWHTSVAHRSSRHRLFRNLVLWLCVVMLALQPLETLAAVQQRTSAESADQRRVSADFAEKSLAPALRDASQAPAGLVSAALFGALPTPTGSGGSDSVSTAFAHLERLEQVNPTPNRFVGSAGDTESGGASWGGGGAPVGSPALALLLPQTVDPEPANRLPGPYTYASHRPTQGSGGTSALPGANPGLFAAWSLGLEANEDLGGLVGLGQAVVRVLLYVECVLDSECLASLTELQALGEELRVGCAGDHAARTYYRGM